MYLLVFLFTWEDSIKMNFQELGRSLDWFDLTLDAVMNLRVSYIAGNALTS
jgi:hypothetical protein